MTDSPFRRRLITVPLILTGFLVTTVLAPALAATAFLIDLLRWGVLRKPWMAVRIFAFALVYLLGEVWAVISLGAAVLLGRRLSVRLTYALQRAWTAWNFRAVRSIFRLDFEVSGLDAIEPGPILLLSRHASLIDTLLPATFVTRSFGIRLKYVLKKELLADPALDIAGSRLPNYFLDRDSHDSAREKMGISSLATDLGSDEGVLIYPEGTRFSESKLNRFSAKLKGEPGAVGKVASELKKVLPPRPGGTLALLEASTADVVLLMHRGLEGFARVKDVWRGGLVGSTIEVRFRRIARSDIPVPAAERVEWLFGVWADIDRWVVGTEAT